MIQKFTTRPYLVVCVLSLVAVSCDRPVSSEDGSGKAVESLSLPIDIEKVSSSFPKGKPNPQSLLSLEQVGSGVKVFPGGYAVRYAGEIKLLNGTVIQGEDITGKVLVGPWPFAEKDSRFRVKRFYRKTADVISSKVTSLVNFFKLTTTNSEGWKVGDQGRFAMRLTLSVKTDAKSDMAGKSLGIFETFMTVRMQNDGTLVRQPAILEGPAINMVTSDDPERVVISLVSDVPRPATVLIGKRKITGPAPVQAGSNWYRHEITVDGLEPDSKYRYRIQVGPTESQTSTFRTAPVKGASGFRFAFIGDSRAGVGNSMTDRLGQCRCNGPTVRSCRSRKRRSGAVRR